VHSITYSWFVQSMQRSQSSPAWAQHPSADGEQAAQFRDTASPHSMTGYRMGRTIACEDQRLRLENVAAAGKHRLFTTAQTCSCARATCLSFSCAHSAGIAGPAPAELMSPESQRPKGAPAVGQVGADDKLQRRECQEERHQQHCGVIRFNRLCMQLHCALLHRNAHRDGC
jgi:hypothetical protein